MSAEWKEHECLERFLRVLVNSKTSYTEHMGCGLLSSGLELAIQQGVPMLVILEFVTFLEWFNHSNWEVLPDSVLARFRTAVVQGAMESVVCSLQ